MIDRFPKIVKAIIPLATKVKSIFRRYRG